MHHLSYLIFCVLTLIMLFLVTRTAVTQCFRVVVVGNFDKCTPFILYFSCFVNIWRLKGMMEGFLSVSV